jgi:hypothetical protein
VVIGRAWSVPSPSLSSFCGGHRHHLVSGQPDLLGPQPLRHRRHRNAPVASGINVKRSIYTSYIINGILAGLAGVIFMSRNNAASPTALSAMK